MYALSDLESKGYIVVPNFLNSKELIAFNWDYDHANRSDTVQDVGNSSYYTTSEVSSIVLKIIQPKILKLAKEISDTTSISADLYNAGAEYYSSELIEFPWHQDHGAWYTYQQHSNYLNFYLVIKKENSELSGLSLIPFDVLAHAIPDQIDKVINQGASRFFVKDKQTLYINDNTGVETLLNCSLEDLKYSPNLNQGDLLLFRGDVIHRTQDSLSNRRALSIRITSGAATINKTKLLAGGLYKTLYLKDNQQKFQALLAAFDHYQRDEITAFEYLSFKDNPPK
jgi:hypothetical protein